MTSESSMYEAGHPKWVLWEDLEGWSREGGVGGRVQDGGYTCILWLIHADVWQNHHYIVK